MVTTQEVVNLFLDHDEADDQVGGQRTVTIRMDSGRLAYIDGMASQAKVSRNVMANHLLGLGINEVMASLPSPVAEDVMSEVADRMGDA